MISLSEEWKRMVVVRVERGAAGAPSAPWVGFLSSAPREVVPDHDGLREEVRAQLLAGTEIVTLRDERHGTTRITRVPDGDPAACRLRVAACVRGRGHRPEIEVDGYGATGSVAVHPYTEESPRAQGGAMVVQRCGCGAERRVLRNAGAEEIVVWQAVPS